MAHDYAEQWEATEEELVQEAEEEGIAPPDFDKADGDNPGKKGESESKGDKGKTPTTNPVLTEGGGAGSL